MQPLTPSSPRSFRDGNGFAVHGRERVLGHGEMADRVRGHDWSATPLGPYSSWCETLLGMVNLVLASSIASVIHWGP